MEDKEIIMFDGVCNLCNGFVQYILKHETSPYFYFTSLQSDAGKNILQSIDYQFYTEDPKSVLLVKGKKVFEKSTAAIEILRKLNTFGKFAVVLYIFPSFIRDLVYDWIARNRYKWFGKQEVCWMPDPKWKSRFL